MKRLLILLSILICLSGRADAHYTQTCKIKYKMTDGSWSKYYTVDVKFMDGSEMNDKTNSTVYSIIETYACVFWSDDKVTVIKLSSLLCTELDHDCINNRVSKIQGIDQDKRLWEICPSGNCY